jgi:hypothetical protein
MFGSNNFSVLFRPVDGAHKPRREPRTQLIHLLCVLYIPGDQEGLFKLAVQLRNFFNWVIYNTATGYVLLVYLTNI